MVNILRSTLEYSPMPMRPGTLPMDTTTIVKGAANMGEESYDCNLLSKIISTLHYTAQQTNNF